MWCVINIERHISMILPRRFSIRFCHETSAYRSVVLLAGHENLNIKGGLRQPSLVLESQIDVYMMCDIYRWASAVL